jgi:hypothetical protein
MRRVNLNALTGALSILAAMDILSRGAVILAHPRSAARRHFTIFNRRNVLPVRLHAVLLSPAVPATKFGGRVSGFKFPASCAEAARNACGIWRTS